jgi:hypothetical protein
MMETKDSTMITFRLTSEEFQALDTRAAEAGMSRSDYLRMILFAPSKPANDDLEALIKHCIYIVNQTHDAVFSIAEAQGNERRFLTREELEKVYREVQARVLTYAVEFPKKLAALRDEIMVAGQKQSK